MLLTLLLTATATALASSPPRHPPNEVAYRLTAKLDPATSTITGTERVRVVNHTGAALDRLWFHVYPNAFREERDGTYMRELMAFEHPDARFLSSGEGAWLRVEGISANGRAADFELKQELLSVRLPAPLADGGAIELQLEFKTRIAAVAERSGAWDGNFSVGQWFPKLVVHDEYGWALQHNGGYHATGEFYGDFGEYDVELRVPEAMRVGATGHLLEERKDAGWRVLHYRATRVHDFAFVADAAFREETILAGETRVHVLTRNPDSRVIGEYAARALEYFSKRVGPYPYPDFTVAETYYNGTMEYPGIIFVRSWPAWSSRWFEREATRLLELGVVHETGHQWFYGAVGNNEVVDAWLDEGFTTYLEIAFMRDTYGASENLVKWGGSVASLSDRQLGALAWRSETPGARSPIQTASYLFAGPGSYLSAVYYRTAQFFQHFEALVGREKLDEMLRDYFKRLSFRNARPADWYAVVQAHAGLEAEKWWRDWIDLVDRCDYSVSGLDSRAEGDGYVTRFRVAQEGTFFAPVDVDVEERGGKKTRVRAYPTALEPSKLVEVRTAAPVSRVEVDPDLVSADSDRFNNTPGLLPAFAVFPFTTSTLRADAITLAPLPLLNKRPGIGIETGLIVPLAHYLDWQGYLAAAYDWQHESPTLDMAAGTFEPEHAWGWQARFRQDVLVNRGGVYAEKRLGRETGHDPRQTLLAGPEYFGELGDGQRGVGVGLDYLYSNLDHGRDLGFSLGLHESMIEFFSGQASSTVLRASATARAVAALGYKSRLRLRGFAGTTVGTPALSGLFDLQAEDEGAMRFDWSDVGRFKSDAVLAGSVEFAFPVPYSPWVDRLAVVHGPGWDWHLFADVSTGVLGDARPLADAGLGTTVAFGLGGFAGLLARLDLVMYQNAVAPGGWGSPIVLFGLSMKGPL